MSQQAIEIYAPRWRDRVALVATYKVTPGQNLVRFTRAGAYNGTYAVDGGELSKCTLESNGRIDCYAVPLAKLQRVEDI